MYVVPVVRVGTRPFVVVLNVAYAAETVDRLLDSNERHFFAQPGNFQYDAQAGAIRISKIFYWFGEDFGTTPSAQMKRIAPYLADARARKLAKSGAARISFLQYDWGLNEQATPRTASGR